MSRPTPETDAAALRARQFHKADADFVALDFARNLERQRDELAEKLSAIVNTWSANSGRLRLAVGETMRFQVVDETIEQAKAALATKEGGV